MGGEDKPVVVALAVDEAERVWVQLTTTDEAGSKQHAADNRPVHVKLKVDRAGYVHVTLDANPLHKHSWAKHQFKKLIKILTHKKSKGGDTNSPADKTTEAQSPATPHKSPFWRIGSRAQTPTAQQA